jgi:YjbE family integral membrane protein
MDPFQAPFWLALLQIVLIDIILSGDNAVVIALAVRSLPPRHRRWGIALGTGGAVALRVLLASIIIYLLDVPYLKLAGGLLLFWVGFKLLNRREDGKQVDAAANLFEAVKIIVIADAVISFDNMIAVAAASKGSVVLLGLGLVISIPLVVFGATLLLKAFDRMPFMVPGGAALIGYIGAEIALRDPLWQHWAEAHAVWTHLVVPLAAAVGVVVAGRIAQPVAPQPLGREALGGAALFGARALLRLLVARSPWIVAVVASLFGYSWTELQLEELHALRGMDTAFAALRPLFAAVIAIAVGERLAAWIRPPQTTIGEKA